MISPIVQAGASPPRHRNPGVGRGGPGAVVDKPDGDVGCHQGAPQRAQLHQPADRPGRPGPDPGGGPPGPVGPELAAVGLRGRHRPRRADRTGPGVAGRPGTWPSPRPPSRWSRRGWMTSAAARAVRYDLGQATMSMMIAAADLGIGSGHASVGDQDLARRLLGFPGGPVPGLPDRAGLPGRPAAGPAGPAGPAAVPGRRALWPLVTTGPLVTASGRSARPSRYGSDGKQYESLDASPPCSRTWCVRRPRHASPSGKNRSSNVMPPPGATSSLAIQAPTPSG